jgi:hypothetical protein
MQTSQFDEILKQLTMERSLVVLALAEICIKHGYNIGFITDPLAATAWKNMVMLDLPTGQVSWHINEDEWSLFEHLPAYRGEWDGHSKEQRTVRINALH